MMSKQQLNTVLILSVTAVIGCGENLTLPPDRAAYEAAPLAPLECLPNSDGVIEADELLVGFNVPVSYRVNPAGTTRAVNLAGLVDQDGVKLWDLSTDDADDQQLIVFAEDPTGKWYASSFPTGEFAAALDASGTIEGVYQRDEDGVYLLGYASSEEAPPAGKTLVVYTEPVVVYQLPLREGAEWVSVGEIRNATVRDLPYAGRDIYTISVDDSGELWLPELQFEQVLRVRTDLVIEPSVGEGLTRKQVGWVFECFGEVARVVSRDDETKDNFEIAVEMRRLGR